MYIVAPSHCQGRVEEFEDLRLGELGLRFHARQGEERVPRSRVLREAFGQHPQLAAIWGRYGSDGTGSRLVMEEVLQALRTAGLPDEEIPVGSRLGR
ncbi:hypothetical protein [Nocardia sp. NPDC049707]|uniref:hypothetical protein n=1 Tax=Nocardia sp. NPDC049707 TaxID=3154735 RepID=UPI0034194E59